MEYVTIITIINQSTSLRYHRLEQRTLWRPRAQRPAAEGPHSAAASAATAAGTPGRRTKDIG